MNWKLISYLNLYGLVMALATISWIPFKFEPIFWLIIFLICAYLIAKKCSSHYFLNGFMVSIFNSIWITAAHVIFFNSYMAHHPEMTAMNENMPMSEMPRLMMLITGPVIGAVSGIVLGLFSWVASKVVRKEN